VTRCDLALQGDELRGVEDDWDVARRVGLPVEEEAHLDLRRRIADADAEEEAIELRLGERERPREVLRVLRRDDEERVGERDGLPVERDLPLVHRLEQGGLRARARAVDLVGEEDVREDGALPQDELARPLVVDGDAEDVARKRSLVNCTRRSSPPTAFARARASVVLPTPGTSSMSRCPRARSATSASSTASCFPSSAALDGLSQRLERRKLLGDQRIVPEQRCMRL
jgi:hypothetical protein